MDEDITVWLKRHGGAKHLTVALARELAEESRTGWFISSHGTNGYVVGKFAVQKLTLHHIITHEDGNTRYFATVAEARAFLEQELGILHVHTFDF